MNYAKANELRVLITVPDLNLIGGKANYYSALQGRFVEQVEYFTYGPRKNSKTVGKLGKVIRLFTDYVKFYKQVKEGNFHLVHINPSLEPHGFIRDSVFLFIASVLINVKTLVFWRGWSIDFEKTVEGSLRWLFMATYKRASAMIILANDFKIKLEEWGYEGPIYQETTVLAEHLVENLSEEVLAKKYTSKNTRLLFLSRLESNKGVFQIVDAFVELKKDYPNLLLDFGGTGGAMNGLVKKLEEVDSAGIRVLGFVQGEQKKKLLQDSHIFLFPSTHAEGLPNSILEAMGCGMPILTTWNAGIKDFFEDEKMGLVLRNVTTEELLAKLRVLLSNTQLQQKMAIDNYRYAQEHFLATKVVVRLENIYRKVCHMNVTD